MVTVIAGNSQYGVGMTSESHVWLRPLGRLMRPNHDNLRAQQRFNRWALFDMWTVT